MNQLIMAIVFGALGYAGYQYYQFTQVPSQIYDECMYGALSGALYDVGDKRPVCQCVGDRVAAGIGPVRFITTLQKSTLLTGDLLGTQLYLCKRAHG